MTTYWKADKKRSAEIKAILDEMSDGMKRAKALAKRVGAEGAGVLGESLEYFAFGEDKDPDRKEWVRHRKWSNWWKPRRLKKNMELLKEMAAFKFEVVDKLMAIVGAKHIERYFVGHPGAAVVKGAAYLAVPDKLKIKTKGFKRICDVDYEKACGKDGDDDE